MEHEREGRKAGWRPVVVVSSLSILIFGGFAVLILIAPEGSRADRWGPTGAAVFVAIGLAVIVAFVALLRPGSPLLVRAERLDNALKELVGSPSALFAGTVTPSDREAFERLTGMAVSPSSVIMLAVGPNAVAIGKAGPTPRTAVLAHGDAEVRFGLGGPGGGLMQLKSAETPTLTIELDTALGALTLVVDSLVSPRAATTYRDERDVRDLIAELTALRASP